MNLNPFTLYPQAPDAHPERPWWCGPDDCGYFRRTDGAWLKAKGGWFKGSDGGAYAELRTPISPKAQAADDDDSAAFPGLAAFDTTNPLPCPPPLIKQVWVWVDSGEQWMVQGIADFPWTLVLRDGRAEVVEFESWPSPGAVLIAGPGAPWAPPGWRP